MEAHTQNYAKNINTAEGQHNNKHNLHRNKSAVIVELWVPATINTSPELPPTCHSQTTQALNIVYNFKVQSSL